jgi:uncharacterized protein (DUF433 family)
MTTAAKVTYPHIVKIPGYCGGKAAIDATRVRVADVVSAHKGGASVDQILVDYPGLSLAQVHAALTYYYDHVDEIEAIFAHDAEVEANATPEQLVRRR